MIDIHSYYSTGNLFESNKRMSMFSGVGCPRRCSFCDVQTKKVERINPRLVLDEMIYLQSIGAGSIHIYEDNFNTDEDYLRRLCSEIDKRNFKGEWSGRGQIKMNDEISGMLSERGFKRIHAGLESFSDKTLKFFRKGQTYDQIERFCETMHNNDIEIVGFLIYGAPTDTEHDRATAAEKIKRYTAGMDYKGFTKDTKIKLTDGRNLNFEELIREKPWAIKKILFPTELVFVIRKRHDEQPRR